LLDENDIKEELSYAYLHAVAANVGYSCDRPQKDRDSVDVQVKARFPPGGGIEFISPEISFQLKATTKVEATEEMFTFDLPIKNFRDLRINHPFPRLLMVLVLPKDRSEWIQVDKERLIAKNCSYWCNLKMLEDSDNKTKKSIHVSTKNLLTPQTLKKLMEKSARREEIGDAL
jgi:hypothetical protein